MRKRVLVIFIVLFSLFVVLGSWGTNSFLKLTSQNSKVISIGEHKRILRKILFDINKSEIFQKRFLITGKKSHLSPYFTQKKEILKNIAELNSKLGSDLDHFKNERKHLKRIKKLFVEKDKILQKVAKTRKVQGISGAVQQILKGKSRTVDEEIQAEVKALEALLTERLLTFKKISREFEGETLDLILFFNGFVLFLFLVGAVGIYRDFLKKEENEVVLNKARVEAEKAMHAKANFLASMSHEVRTPMNAIIGGLNLMQDFKIGGKQRKLLNTIRSSSDHLLSLINDVLDLSKIESGKLEVEETNLSINDLLDDVRNIFNYQFLIKKLFLKVDYSSVGWPWIKSDPTRLRQILVNIVGNAMKFTSEGGVSMRVTAEDSFDRPNGVLVKIEIKDTGIGIEEDKLDAIFDDFSQADTTTTRKYGGTGLGLSISKKLALLLNGDITVNSQPGVGSIFTLTFLAEKGDQKEKSNTKESLGSLDLSKKRVLIVEDNKVNQEILSATLARYKVKTDTADSGLIGLEKLSNGEEYDLVFMDLQMPELDGKQATRSIREQGFNTPIVALTANSSLKEKRECIEIGMDAYLTKPFVEEDLLQCLLDLSPLEGSVDNRVTLNLEALAKLTRLEKKLEQDGFVNNLIEIYKQDSKKNIEELIASSKDGKMEEIKYIAHTLASSALNLGGEKLGYLLRDLEERTSEDVEEELEEVVLMIEQQNKSFISELEKARVA